MNSSDYRSDQTLTWFQGHFDAPEAVDMGNYNTSFALDLSSLNKGVAYVNGFNLGRYWMLPGKCSGTCAPPIHGDLCHEYWRKSSCGRPTQHLYHIPKGILQPTDNLVVIFEESSDLQVRSLARVAMVSVHEHPSLD